MISSLLSLYIASTIQTTHSASPETFLNKVAFQLNQTEEVTISNSPVKNDEMIAPILGAKAVLSIDIETGDILYEKDAYKSLPMASITKIMTNLIILEENKLDEIVTVSSKAASQPGSRMNIYTGEKLTVQDLIYGSMIQSGNDASTALAEHNAGSVAAFVEKMNTKAETLNLSGTHYRNPTGLDAANHYSTAYDIATLTQEAYKNEFLKQVVQTKEITVSGHKLTNTNILLDSYLNIKGFKTGKTSAAGLCLVTIAENDSQNQILTVVLGSPDRFTETKILIDWVFRAYTW